MLDTAAIRETFLDDLRDTHLGGPCERCTVRELCDEVDRLRAQLEECAKSRNHALDELQAARNEAHELRSLLRRCGPHVSAARWFHGPNCGRPGDSDCGCHEARELADEIRAALGEEGAS